MSFEEAIEKLINTYGYEILDKEFLARSILSDYIGSDIYANRLINSLLLINKHIKIYPLFKEQGLTNGRKTIATIYKDVKDKCIKSEFIDSVNALAKLICPIEYEEALKNKQANQAQNKIVINRVKPNNNPNKVNIVNNVNNNVNVIPHVPTTNNDIYDPTNNNFDPNKIYINVPLKIVDYNHIRAIKIKGRGTRLDVEFGTIEPYRHKLDGFYRAGMNCYNTIYKNMKCNIEKGVLVLDLRTHHPQQLRLQLHAKNYEFVEIIGSDMNLYVGKCAQNYYYKLPPFKIDKLNIDVINTEVHVERLNLNNVYVTNTAGKIEMDACARYYKILNGTGLIAFKLLSYPFKEMTIKSKVKYGNILIDFIDSHIKPRVTRFLKKTPDVYAVTYAKDTKINLDLHVKIGRIRVD